MTHSRKENQRDSTADCQGALDREEEEEGEAPGDREGGREGGRQKVTRERKAAANGNQLTADICLHR